LHDQVDLADFGLPVPVNQLKAVLLQQPGDRGFGLQALFGGFNNP